MDTNKKPVLRLEIPSPEANILKLLIDLDKPTTVKELCALLPELKAISIANKLTRLRTVNRLVARTKIIDKEKAPHRYFIYQPAPGAKEKYDWALTKSKQRSKTQLKTDITQTIKARQSAGFCYFFRTFYK